jgi:hypothetical protein
MKHALEALEKSVATCFHEYAHEQVMSFPEHFINQTITALRAAIEQSEEPCAMRYSFDGNGYRYIDSGSGSNWQEFAKRNFPDAEPLYEHPRQWVGLTEEEIKLLWEQYGYKSAMCKPFARAIEAKLKDKNHG